MRGYKLAQKISGCWRTLQTLQRHCRIRSYLTSTRNYGVRPIDAIHDALTGTPKDATHTSMIHRHHPCCWSRLTASPWP